MVIVGKRGASELGSTLRLVHRLQSLKESFELVERRRGIQHHGMQLRFFPRAIILHQRGPKMTGHNDMEFSDRRNNGTEKGKICDGP